jgi:hypothetical protein
MRRTVLFAVLFCFALASLVAAETSVSLEQVTNVQDDSLLLVGQQHGFQIRMTNTSSTNYNISNGFRLFSPDGAEWGWPARDTTFDTVIPGVLVNTIVDSILVIDPTFELFFNVTFNRIYTNTDGVGADTVAFAGAANAVNLGLRPGTDVVAYEFPIQPTLESHNTHICIDSSWFPPGGTWKWAAIDLSGQIAPDWSGQECFKVFNPEAPQGELAVSPAILSFTAIAGGANPDPQKFEVADLQGGNIAYTAAASEPWISLVNASGTTDDSVTVSVNITGLAADTYVDTVEVTSAAASNSPQYVEINLQVSEPPKSLVTSEDTLFFTTVQGAGNPTPQAFTVSEEGGTNIPFTVTETPEVDWITLGNASSTTPDDVTVSIDAMTGGAGGTELPAGDYEDSLIVASAEADNSPIYVVVMLTVEPPPKFLAVTPDTIEYSFVQGGTPPPTQSVLVSETGGENIAFTLNTTAPWLTPTADSLVTPVDVDMVVDFGSLSLGTSFDSVEIALAEADNSPIFAYVSVEVTAAPDFVISPDTLKFAAVAGGADPDSLPFNVALSDGGNIAFEAVETSAWFAVDPTNATTPAPVYVKIDISGLIADTYLDSVRIQEAPLAAGSSPAYPEQVEPAYAYVQLTITEAPKNLVVDPDSLAFGATVGDQVMPILGLNITEEGGGAIPYTASTGADWIVLTDASGTTPGVVTVSIDITGLPPGTHVSSITVESAEAVNSPQIIPVSLELLPCAQLVLENGSYDYTVFEGETVLFDDTLSLTSTGPAEINWSTSVGTSSGFTVDPTSGTTPSELAIHYEATYENAGTFADTLFVSSDPIPDSDCGSEVMVIVNVTVNPLPSADTVRVVTTGAIPGASFDVPIEFANSCDVVGLSGSISWESEYLILDSISYEESDLVGFNFTDAIDNELDMATFSATVDGGTPVPPKVGETMNNWLNLHFTVSCDAPLGTYPLTMPAAGDQIVMERDCGEGTEQVFPEVVPGNILLGSEAQFFCGWVVEPDGVGGYKEIEGATVELWQDFPTGTLENTTTSSGIGSFAFDSVETFEFSIYAYKDGYYPADSVFTVEDKGAFVVLMPYEEVVPTSEYVFYHCAENTFQGVPLPVGSVVEARVTNDIVTDYLVGQWFVTTAGEYGNMPVYRANDQFNDLGARTGNTIEFYVNGLPAQTTGDVIYPADNFLEIQVCLEAGAVVEKEYVLNEGWNTVSWNVVNSLTGIKDLFGPYLSNIEVIVGFEQGGLIYDPLLERFSTLWTVDHLSGYWIKVKPGMGFTLVVEGAPLSSMPGIQVTPGWNFLSYLPDQILTPEAALESLISGGNLQFAYGFDETGIQVFEPGAGTANTLEEMVPGSAYWMKVNATGVLTYPGDGPVAAPGVLAGARGASSAGLVAGVTTTPNMVAVYSSGLTVDGRIVPAGAVVTAVSDEGEVVGKGFVRQNGEFGFMPVYAGESVSLQPGDRFRLEVDGLETDEEFEWTENGDRIEVMSLTTGNGYGGNMPTTYSLAQNYPNPFNPTTTISFTMPTSGQARIEVFNILGKLIATPFDGHASAGENTVVWDGRDNNGEQVASGVYLYRLTAGDYNETRKMMLLK